MSSPEIPRPHRPESAPIIAHEAIPDGLKRLPQWVCWRYVDRGPDKKPDKRPVNPHNLKNAGVNWPNTWSNFPHSYMVYLMYKQRAVDGIGFVLTGDDPFVGLDLDHCIEAGLLLPWAQDVLDRVNSYTEISPSGSGLRILATAPGFSENRRRDRLEIYSRQRFLTVTGIHLADTPGEILPVSDDQLAELIPAESQTVPPPVVPEVEASRYDITPDELWERIFAHDRFGEQHRRRFMGDTSLDGGDHSLTVIRLLNCLALWTRGDSERIRSMMLMSPLANEKWLSRRGKGDWLGHQIEDALRYAARLVNISRRL